MATAYISTNTELSLVNALTQSLTLYLPQDPPNGKNLFIKDAAGNSLFSSITLRPQGTNIFEDGSLFQTLNSAYESMQLNYISNVWYFTGGTMLNTMRVSTIQSQTSQISNLSSANISVSSFQISDSLTSNVGTFNTVSSMLYYNGYNIGGGIRTAIPQTLKNYSFSPQSLLGLQLWLDAADSNTMIFSGSQVLQWNDKSSNKYNAVGTLGTVPTLNTGALNSLNTLTFNGTNQFYTLTNNYVIGNNNFYFAALVNIPVQVTTAGRAILTSGVAPASSYYFSAFYNTLSLLPQTQFTYYPVNKVFTGVLNNFTGLIVGWNICLYTVSQGFQSFYANGTLGVTNTSNTLAIYPTGVVYLGRQSGGGNTHYNSDMAELLMFFDNPNTLKRQQVEGYLAWKWGLQGNLPANHPYKNAPPS